VAVQSWQVLAPQCSSTVHSAQDPAAVQYWPAPQCAFSVHSTQVRAVEQYWPLAVQSWQVVVPQLSSRVHSAQAPSSVQYCPGAQCSLTRHATQARS
jgi:hypothetical protein